ncbi:hypothetical protein B9G69_017985 [Bdellovibrio sp. SKB1291214]|uniref:hypothetical protein n=1 Tax=Bdellovibrio sp. SKB1291214 TaxID=1732569 RepID=UPI000B745E24|nr:hypothetical protein [Bdellovibrio sp. SKB1291214]UYL08930.1 hypothetical protein B9G69_017985 [Bdellovibrio sp. SKB1291214]
MKTMNLKNLLILTVMTSFSAACSKMTFTPVVTTEAASSAPTNAVSFSQVVGYGNKQVDFLVVFDDSNSMLPDLKKLAASLGDFVGSLETSGIDWQMCMTTTRAMNNQWGFSADWTGYTPPSGTPAYLLKKGTANLTSIFENTVNAMAIGGTGSADERGLKATYNHFALANSNGCYRAGAAVSVILVSNEDERSVGGDASKMKAGDAAGSLLPLEAEDMPDNVIAMAKQKFGNDIRFTFNSIIVKPNDKSCEAMQDAASASPSHEGVIYDQLSVKTEGGVGSICDSSFATTLNTFRDKIVNSMTHMTLQCVPVAGSVKIGINGANFTQFKVEGNILKFNSALVEGTKIDLAFDCP